MNLCVRYWFADGGDDSFVRWMGLGSGHGEMAGCAEWRAPLFLTFGSCPRGCRNSNLNARDTAVRLRLDSLYYTDGRRLGQAGITYGIEV